MKGTFCALSLFLLAMPAWSEGAMAQRGSGGSAQGGGRQKAPNILEVPTEPGIAWFGSWEAGLAEAKRTDRPILLMSAAPQCHGVPGMW